jgi:CheY-like chemotaxis protein
MLRLTIRDPGPAIDPAARARLFQPFVQLGDAVAAGNVGTGLGLAICQTLAGLLGGEIGYRPGEDGGNAFWVRLAFDLPPAPPPAVRPVHPRSRVLLVDDIVANQLVTATMLRRDGHMVDVAASGGAALRAVAHVPYDLVLMDIVMPGMSGIEATRRMRALPGPAGVVPICAVTGNASPQDRARYEAAGMSDILVKPVEPDALIEMLGRLVWRHRPTRQPPAPPPPAEEPSTAALLAASRLAALRANLPPATLADLAEAAIAELGERLQPLQQALSSGDALAIEAEAHAAAGIAGGYGMGALEARLRAIVTTARGGRMADAASQAAELLDLLGRSAEALRHAVSGAEVAP